MRKAYQKKKKTKKNVQKTEKVRQRKRMRWEEKEADRGWKKGKCSGWNEWEKDTAGWEQGGEPG